MWDFCIIKLADQNAAETVKAKEDEKGPHDENSAILGQLKMAECEPCQLTVDR